MKKLITFIMLVAMLFTFAGCGEDMAKSETTTDENVTSENSVRTDPIVDEALKLIAENKVGDAYALLYKNRNIPEARKLLGKIYVYPTKRKKGGEIETLDYSVQGNTLKTPDREYSYTYNANGQLLKYVETRLDDKSVYIEENIYDSNNKLVKTLKKDSTGEIVGTTEYIRKVENGLTKEVILYSYGAKLEKTYNSNGDLIKASYYSENGQLEEEYFCEYNKDGFMTKFEEPSQPETVLFSYDDNGRCIEEKIICDEETHVRTITYKNEGNTTIVEILTTSSNGVETNYKIDKLTFDANGNLIKTAESKSSDDLTKIEMRNEREYSDFVYFYFPDSKPIHSPIGLSSDFQDFPY